MENSKDNYYTELCSTITDYNERNNMPLSNVNIREAILQVMREEEEEAITRTNKVTADTFSLKFSPQKESLTQYLRLRG